MSAGRSTPETAVRGRVLKSSAFSRPQLVRGSPRLARGRTCRNYSIESPRDNLIKRGNVTVHGLVSGKRPLLHNRVCLPAAIETISATTCVCSWSGVMTDIPREIRSRRWAEYVPLAGLGATPMTSPAMPRCSMFNFGTTGFINREAPPGAPLKPNAVIHACCLKQAGRRMRSEF